MAFYIFKKQKLIENIQKLKSAFHTAGLENFQIFYSVKTNFSKEVLGVIHENCNFEIVSSDEWDIVKEYAPQQLVLNGPSKSLPLIKDIISRGTKTLFFNVDNDTDLEILDESYAELKEHLKVGIRIYLNKTGIWNRFGFDVESERLEGIITKYKDVIRGFHFHFSTNNFNITNYDLILDKINYLSKKHNLVLEYLDIGGGLPGAGEELKHNNMYNKLPLLIKTKVNPKILIISEVGRNLVEDVFKLETSVVSIKKVSDDHYDVVIDTNILHVPCFYEKKFTLDYSASLQRDKKAVYINIFGNSCMQIDQIADNFLITSTPQVGDKIYMSKVGAYSISQASNFISRIPAVISDDLTVKNN